MPDEIAVSEGTEVKGDAQPPSESSHFNSGICIDIICNLL